jgi:amyloid beta precursor protein binding protein 1
MHSSNTSYIALQNLFKAQHLSDLAEFRGLLEGVLEGICLPGDAIPDEEVESFVRGTGSVAIVKGNSLRKGREGNEALRSMIGASRVPRMSKI